MDEWVSVCGPEGMSVWDNGMFGVCFATLVFSYVGHFFTIGVTAFYLGRFPKSVDVREAFDLPKALSYALQIVLTLLICDPLVKLIIVIFVSGKQNSFVEDFKLMLMFTTWALNLTYYRRLAISNYIKLPGVVPITSAVAFLFFCQIPVLLATANVQDYLNLGFLIAYEVLIFIAILGLVVLFTSVRRAIQRLPMPYVSGTDTSFGGSSRNMTATPSRPLVQTDDPLIHSSYKSTGGVDNPVMSSDDK